MKIVFKYFLSIVIFLLYSLFIFVLTFLFGTLLVGVVFILHGLIITVIVNSLFKWSDSHFWEALQNTSFVVIVVAGTIYPMIFLILLIYYLIAPLVIRSKLGQFVSLQNIYVWENPKLQEIHERLSVLSLNVSRKMGVKNFDAVSLSSTKAIATLQLFRWRILFFNPRLNNCLTDFEIEALIAHELGHLDYNLSGPYAFVRRCDSASRFLYYQSDERNPSFFKNIINIILFPLPDLIKIGYFWAFFSTLKFLAKGVNFYVSASTVFFRKEFHHSEFRADKNAEKYYGNVLIIALLKVINFVLLIEDQNMNLYEENPQDYRRILIDFFLASSTTHPSPHERIEALQNNSQMPLDYVNHLVEFDHYIAQSIKEYSDVPYFQKLPEMVHFDELQLLFLSMALPHLPTKTLSTPPQELSQNDAPPPSPPGTPPNARGGFGTTDWTQNIGV